MKAVVVETGSNTFLGKSALLVSGEQRESNIQVVLARIGWYCIFLIVIWVTVELIVLFVAYGDTCHGVGSGHCSVLGNALVIVVGGVPIAMPTVVSVTLALGAQQLAKQKAIVRRITAVEELAGMDMLCSDKTGTLTKNRLSVAEPIPYDGEDPEDVIIKAALASARDTDDAIDNAMYDNIEEDRKNELENYTVLEYKPFDPVSKRSMAKVRDNNGKVFYVTKGAPQIIESMSTFENPLVSKEIHEHIQVLAEHGYRALGVAISDDGTKWKMLGLIPMFDPPRDDTKETIQKIRELGVRIKMITGDQLAIAKETARILGMGEKIYTSEMIEQLDYHQEIGSDATSLVEIADGFAQVFPEHKYNIVRRLQKRGWIVGMTGDGVNDAPALSLADIGIAVAGSSDAARAAADIVLTESGLSVIVAAIIQARKIFQRMRNYCMYSITSVTRIVLTFGILSISYNWFFPTVAIVILAILNDLSMLSVSRDRVKPSKRPDEWDFVELFTIALVLGGWLTLSSVVLFLIIFQTNFFPSAFHLPQLNFTTVRGLMYLQVSASGLATIFVTRSHGFSWRERPGVSVVLAFVVAQAVASVLGAYGLGGFPHNGITDFGGAGWGWVLLGWIWVIIWYIPMDFLKFLVRIIRRGFFPWAKKHHLLGGKKLRRHKKHAEDETIQKRGATTTAAPPRK